MHMPCSSFSFSFFLVSFSFCCSLLFFFPFHKWFIYPLKRRKLRQISCLFRPMCIIVYNYKNNYIWIASWLQLILLRVEIWKLKGETDQKQWYFAAELQINSIMSVSIVIYILYAIWFMFTLLSTLLSIFTFWI
jgi:hypothetical protein